MENTAIVHPFTKEELANAVTHGIGLLLSALGFAVIIGHALSGNESAALIGSVIFGVALVLMYAASTIYHSARAARFKRIMRIVDHIAIYFLIAGTYTPFLLTHFEGRLQITLMAGIWGLALFGTIFKLFFTGRFRGLSTALYLLMGWLAVFALQPLMAVLPLQCLLWLLIGGLFYTAGVIFFLWERLPFSHAIWHLFVLGGSTCHYVAVLAYVVLFRA